MAGYIRRMTQFILRKLHERLSPNNDGSEFVIEENVTESCSSVTLSDSTTENEVYIIRSRSCLLDSEYGSESSVVNVVDTSSEQNYVAFDKCEYDIEIPAIVPKEQTHCSSIQNEIQIVSSEEDLSVVQVLMKVADDSLISFDRLQSKFSEPSSDPDDDFGIPEQLELIEATPPVFISPPAKRHLDYQRIEQNNNAKIARKTDQNQTNVADSPKITKQSMATNPIRMHFPQSGNRLQKVIQEYEEWNRERKRRR